MELFFTQPAFQLIILLVTALSSFFLIRGVIKLTPAEMARISSTYFDYNPELVKSFAVQKADSVVGFVLLLISITIQAWIISQPLRWIDVGGLTMAQIIFSVIIFVPIVVTSQFSRRFLAYKYKKEVLEELKSKPTPSN